jgi:hypothetical protein
VVDAEGNPVADATHVDKDGGSITTVGGKITEIADATPPADPPAEPTMKEVMQAVTNVGKQFSDMKKLFESNQKVTESALDLLGDQFQDLKTATELKLKNIGSKYDVPAGENPPPAGEKQSAYDPEKAKEIRENRKK